ncbi:MAG: hypothetical protein DYG93_12085 [Leptolyngbya sp. PLA2]|nr:hypothetical protein [Leptolyngbya sp.]MCE7972383.1 hypothetical protein [Leptolyngbya sp. PL-A2]MDL1905021.1 hypothetical protein [Synechococcales cyanobacterium CNB]
MRALLALAARFVPLLAGTVLFLAGIAKAVQPSDTLTSLAWVFGEEAAPASLVLLISVEIVLGSLLVASLLPKWSLGASVLLFSSFLAWIGVLEWMNAPVGCGCGVRLPMASALTSADSRSEALVRAGGMFVLCVLGFVGSCLRTTTGLIRNPAKVSGVE